MKEPPPKHFQPKPPNFNLLKRCIPMKTKFNNNQLNPATISNSLVKKTKSGLYHLPKAISKDELYYAVLNLIQEEYDREQLSSVQDTRKYLRLKMIKYEHEVFTVIFMDTQHCVIKFEEMFSGTIDAASIYAREIVKRALQLNAAAVIFCHNHPSGMPEPSMADKQITMRLIDALSLVDIRVLDHFIIGARRDLFSFAEEGLI